jgi:hypothetical protein
MTKAEIQFEEVQKIPSIKILIDRLDLTILPDRKSSDISARVQQLIDSFALRSNSTQAERYIHTEVSEHPFDPNRVELYLVSLYGPRPWKRPLPFAPF